MTSRVFRSLGCAFLALVTLVPSASASDEPVEYPEFAGRTIIHATGITGMMLRLPSAVELPTIGLNISLAPGTTYGRAVFRHEEYWDNRFPGICDFCFGSGIEYIPEAMGNSPSIKNCQSPPSDHCAYDEGLVEIYIITNGSATLTIDLLGLEGTTELTATGAVDGYLDRLPVNCAPLPDCTNFAYGHVRREIGVGKPGQVQVASWAVIPSRFSPAPSVQNLGSVSAMACAYPGYWDPEGSPEPADHSMGCDDVASSDDPAGNDSLRNTDTFYLTAADRLLVGYIVWSGNAFAHGPVYVGYRAQWQAPVTGGGSHGAFASWLNEGIACPSGKFVDCAQPDG